MNCKPPCLAIIVRAPLNPDGGPIGLVVEVTPDWFVSPAFGHSWRCIFPTPIERVDGTVAHTAVVADDWLQPVSGLDIHDEQLDEAPHETA